MQEHCFALGMLVGGIAIGSLSSSVRETVQHGSGVLLYNIYKLHSVIAIQWESYFKEACVSDYTATYYKNGVAIYRTKERCVDASAPSIYSYVVVKTVVDGRTTESIRAEPPATELVRSEWRVLCARYKRASQGAYTDIPSISGHHHAIGDVLLGELWRKHNLPGVEDIERFEVMDSTAQLVTVGSEQAICVLADGYAMLAE